MTAPARLLALRLQGFKSFAERTLVEFGPGISAVVGPNGSGKSNLADALRWSLGEQGRALRSRKSEDVIFAGSEKRSALGMADVTLVLDNADGLLPVEYSVLELGRRLYRSGENDYLLNKQRIRLRDLVDLLDSAHLADNAFLFIGQGMVDQALALRPEERRPLFEEVAGVRRHERRRRKAEDQLAESETNLARVEDILAELRPQARRLAAQAEQQATRLTAGEELADALLLLAHARWHEAAELAATAATRVERERARADTALADLQAAEEAAAAVAGELSAQATAERERRGLHEAARATLDELRLRDARLAGDRDALARDRARTVEERAAAEADLATQRRALARPAPSRDVELDAALAEAERELAAASAELGGLRTAARAHGEEAAAVRRAEAARQAETETARRRLAEAERRLAEATEAGRAAERRRDELATIAASAAAEVAAAQEAERMAAQTRETTRAAADEAAARSRESAERAAGLAAALAAGRARLEAIEARLREDETRGIARAAMRRGGRRLDTDLVVEPGGRAAVEAALDEAVRAYLVDGATAVELAGERGTLVVQERLDGVAGRTPAAGRSATSGGAAAATERRFLDRLADADGEVLSGAIRRDPAGAATRLLARAAVVADLVTALRLQPDLPPGWIVVVRDGSAVVTELTVRIGRGDAPLERRAEGERLATEVERLAADAATAERAVAASRAAADAGRATFEEARLAEAAAIAGRRTAEERERAAARELEAASREAAWHAAQRTRLAAETDRIGAALAAGPDGARHDLPADPTAAHGTGPDPAIGAWQARATELRTRRDRLAEEQAAHDATRREAEAHRARAEAAIAMDEERIARADRESAALAEREAALDADRDRLAGELAAATRREAEAAAILGEARAADTVARERLATVERDAAAARERLRLSDERLRAADRADLEARLGRDSLHEQLLVELAGLGELGLQRLEAVVGPRPVAVGPGPDPAMPTDDVDATGEGDAMTAALESALEAATTRWAVTPPSGEAPGSGRLAHLRRRYHELGAANPFAVEEYAELKTRLETLEGQRLDLRGAIDRTRELIAELNTMISDQFQATFRALETAFDARFQQLFGGGFARLSLTDPADLSSTGVEIVARPPGKKAQALAMLSGGERALTAVALLFAMLEVRPVPFCVLDEVDAALDEANVGRFTTALRELAERTQCIVITHNRGTIEAADALYGVTVGDDSVSRVISLRLDEAQAIAGRRNGSSAVESEPLAEVG